VEELADGTSFGRTGHAVSSNHTGKRFKAVHHLSERDNEQRGIIDVLDA
jgi:hypothetical protein